MTDLQPEDPKERWLIAELLDPVEETWVAIKVTDDLLYGVALLRQRVRELAVDLGGSSTITWRNGIEYFTFGALPPPFGKAWTQEVLDDIDIICADGQSWFWLPEGVDIHDLRERSKPGYASECGGLQIGEEYTRFTHYLRYTALARQDSVRITDALCNP